MNNNVRNLGEQKCEAVQLGQLQLCKNSHGPSLTINIYISDFSLDDR